MLVTHLRTNVCSKTQKSSFHTSLTVEKYGRQNRAKGNAKNFFRPGWRYFVNLENMHRNDVNSGPPNGFGQYLHRTLMFNWPIGDNYIKDRKPLKNEQMSIWKKRYDDLFPDEITFYGVKSDPEDRKWYRTPKERFFHRLKVHRTRGMSAKKAFDLCLKEKQWEIDARETEYEVQKQQAEVLFGTPETDWEEFTYNSEHLTDDRSSEADKRLWEDRLVAMVNMRKAKPEMRKLKQSDFKVPYTMIRMYIADHPEDAEHFDESVKWDYLPYHSLPTSLSPELAPDGLEVPREEGQENTILEDLDREVSDWAKDLLGMYWDKIDMNNPELTAEDKEDLRQKQAAGLEQRTGFLDAETLVRNMESTLHDEDYYKDGLSEVLGKTKNGRPQVNPNLEQELSSLFKNVE
eukprot:TRINITY_DN2021_c0_g1_i1.p1 TRINITY_DN2021_c0_g1~~TRINITY_DN2021_c0_g1_i1.p1  ORF type:complete len:404 (-),score=107.54 TRINITY_DN2021_c0_g1_i1:138-1349(-)